MARQKLKPITQSHYLVSSPSLPECYFTEFSGIKEKKETSKFPDGVRRRMYSVSGMTSIEDITLSVEYDPLIHDSILTAYERLRDSEEQIKVSIVPVDSTSDPTPIGKGFNVFGCQVIGIEVAQVNRSSSEVSKFTITLTVDEYTRS